MYAYLILFQYHVLLTKKANLNLRADFLVNKSASKSRSECTYLRKKVSKPANNLSTNFPVFSKSKVRVVSSFTPIPFLERLGSPQLVLDTQGQLCKMREVLGPRAHLSSRNKEKLFLSLTKYLVI